VNTEAFQVELLKLVLALVMLEEVVQVLYLFRDPIKHICGVGAASDNFDSYKSLINISTRFETVYLHLIII
jgi:hypothetical protein